MNCCLRVDQEPIGSPLFRVKAGQRWTKIIHGTPTSEAHWSRRRHLASPAGSSPQPPVLGRTRLQGAAKVAPFYFGLRSTLSQRNVGMPFAVALQVKDSGYGAIASMLSSQTRRAGSFRVRSLLATGAKTSGSSER